MTLVVAGILFNSEGKVLIAQRKRGRSFELWWEFPGGKVDPGESELTALVRELHEELGLTVKECDFTFFGESQVKDKDGHIFLRAYEAEIQLTIGNLPDHEQVAWVFPNELENYQLLAADVPLAEHLVRRRKSPSPMSEAEEAKPTKQFLFTWLFPTIVGKGVILFFGTYYATYPGEGYGYGLAAAMVFTILMLSRFIWVNRNYKD